MSTGSSNIFTIHFASQPDLLLRELNAEEELGRPFRFEVVFYSDERSLAADTFLGQTMAVEVVQDDTSHFYHGRVASFLNVGRFGGYQAYQVELRPDFWFLGFRSDCRIFQNQTVVEVIQAVLGNPTVSVMNRSVAGKTYAPVVYCTQYRESDFDFATRLMEREGLFYYHVHTESSHELVLADSDSNIEAIEGDLPYRAPGQAMVGQLHVSRWKREFRLRTGKVRIRSFDFEKPTVNLEAITENSIHTPKLEVYDYPDRYLTTAHGDNLSAVRLHELNVESRQIAAQTNRLAVLPGRKFTLIEHPDQAENGEYRVIKSHTRLVSGELEQFGNREPTMEVDASVLPVDTVFQLAATTPRPFLGPQTAIVVGEDGEEISVDEFGRIKVQFHWDRLGENNQDSSCWIRVAQTLAGQGWGAIQIPRIGHEVIVDFLNGDPDQPIVTGSVYNADNTVPYALPANKTQSGIKTRSTGDGTTETFNELRFEDKIDEEEIYFHAERDFKRVVENDDVLEVGMVKSDPGDQTISVYNNRTVNVLEGDETKNVDKGNQTINVLEGNQEINIDQGDQTTTIAQGDQNINVTQGDQTTNIDAGDQVINIAQGNGTITLDAGEFTIEAASKITLTVGSSSITIEPASITISSTEVTVEGTATANLEGATVNVDGSGMANVSGGVLNLN